MAQTVFETKFDDLSVFKRGKVRDVYDLEDRLLMVATDRISAFDVIMKDPVPGKGKILTRISLFWFDIISSIIDNHVIASDVDQYPQICRQYRDELEGRSMLVKKTRPLPVECVVRGYISGSGWKSYQKTGEVCGIRLPDGLRESDRLPEPIFTPSTKAELGEHDINISYDHMVDLIGTQKAQQVRDLSLEIYQKGAEIAEKSGIIIADTKFEFGENENGLILIDEVLTPDSSRFWPKATYQPGGPQASFDKQYLRDYLNSVDWDKTPPPPHLPAEVIENTKSKYLEALQALVGQTDAS
ncbi:phosphoribosylaminoimidazole-succinocarboxamide synthase [Desulfosalsimonas propionicica]|uniref:Phosphoribosylaminoimidazole-succinocarboxamide synthase n=1 Tax=Desulfosalsimonas propionicica TaxID=332175 RepID=A0A7W0C7P9_9BACT|nr:phosphoribosylaminoimidazolesuccinocarboxamide synthase [Desulfosalsimonas propionicica]MBA2880710.1 phosphoribosylaminoimidazole-succinocarboxamide synthase [Desulfosalsimonas propionicica]